MKEFSYQLFSSRNFGPIDRTLAMLAELGYSYVEGYGALFASAEDAVELSSQLNASGLTMPTAHIALSMLEQKPGECVDIAETLDLEAVFVPHLTSEERPSSSTGWREMGARAQEAMLPLIEAGVAIGWHNHDFELVTTDNGKTALDNLMAGGPALQLELDLAWVAVSGIDPVNLANRYSHRLSSVHIKDIAPKGECLDEDGWADVGHGIMDWHAIATAVGRSSARYFILEHDNPKDDRRFASRSIQFANSLWNN